MNETNNLSTEQSVETGNVSDIPSEVVSETVLDVTEYTVDNPLPVQIIEGSAVEEEIDVFSLTGTCNGTISDTYLDYFEGIVQKLSPLYDYVIWRSGQNAYTMAYSDSLALENDVFSGDCNCVDIYRDSDSYSSTWYVTYYNDSININADGLFVYSSLGQYPTVVRGMKAVEGTTILLTVAVMFLFNIVTAIFRPVSR